MLYNLLAEELPNRTVDLSVAALYAALGFAIVFLGIAFLIFVVWLVGKIMYRGKKPVKTTVKPVEAAPVEKSADEEISEETLAVIMAALMAYYQQNNPKCEFTVKRIKRI